MTLWLTRVQQLIRRLRRAPMFTAVTVLTLAIGIGANIAMFTVVDRVILKPLPYPSSDRLVAITYNAAGMNIGNVRISPSHYFVLREKSTTLEDIGAYLDDEFDISGRGAPEHVQGFHVTDGVPPLMGAKPSLGRLFTRQDDSPSAPKTVVVSHGYWQRRLNSDPAIIGKSLTVDGETRQIVGVLGRGFQILDYNKADVLVPFQWERNKTYLGNYSYRAIARLKPGVSLQQANTDVGRLIPITFRTFPAPPGTSEKLFDQLRLAPNLRPLRSDVIGSMESTLWIVMGAIGLVLVAACANVANLLLVRIEGRRQELAVRSALGATLLNIAFDLIAESLVLVGFGSIFGLSLAYGFLRSVIWASPRGLPRLHEIGLDGRSLVFAVGLAIGCSIFIAFVPLAKFAFRREAAGLREGGRTLSQGRERLRARKALVVLQVATAVVLLVCSGLMVRTFLALSHVEPGFDAQAGIEMFWLNTPESEIPEAQPERVVRKDETILRRIETLPGVTSASFSATAPLAGHGSNDVVYSQDNVLSGGKIPPMCRFDYVGPGYFKNLGEQIVAGREITWTDTYNRIPVAMISENMAQKYWGSAQGALGKRIRSSGVDDWREIIGVVGDVHEEGMGKATPLTVYWPIINNNFEGSKTLVQRSVVFAVRSSRAGSDELLREIENQVWSINSNTPLADPTTLRELYRKSMASTALTLVLIAAAGTMALLLSVLGIYGVISYTVAQRSREVGIRMALGARRTQVVNIFLREGLVLTLIGTAAGLAVSLGSMRMLSTILFNVSAFDLVTYSGASLVIFAIASVACLLPSRRAASIEPVAALRVE